MSEKEIKTLAQDVVEREEWERTRTEREAEKKRFQESLSRGARKIGKIIIQPSTGKQIFVKF